MRGVAWAILLWVLLMQAVLDVTLIKTAIHGEVAWRLLTGQPEGAK